MELSDYISVWDKLTAVQQHKLIGCLANRSAKRGTVIHNGSTECTGLLLIESGQLRAWV